MTARNRRWVRFITALIVAALGFSPAIATICWHLRHDGQINYGGAHFVVPRRWSVSISPTGAYFEKRPLTVLSPALLAWATLAPTRHPPRTGAELEAFYASFAAIYWTRLLREQEIQQGPIRVRAAGQEAFCMQSVLTDRRDWFHVTCLVSRGTWNVDFQGTLKDKTEFFDRVLGLPDVRLPENKSAGAPR